MKFIRNLAAFTDALGVENAPTVMFLSQMQWPSDESRNQFIKELTKMDMKELRTYGE
jgi:hypothetical protein